MQPGSTITPSGSGPDQDKNNPFNKKWESPSPTEEISREDVDKFVEKVEKYANDPANANKKEQSAAAAESRAGGRGGGDSNSAKLPGEDFSYNPRKKNKRKITLTRRQKYAATAAGFLGGGLLFAAIPLLAPLKLMQFGNLIRSTHFFSGEDFGEDRSGKMFRRYLRRGSIQGTRLGAIGNRVAGVWEQNLIDKSGVRMLYDGSGSLAGVEIFDEEKARNSGALDGLEELDGLTEETGDSNLTVGKEGGSPDPNKRRFRSSNGDFFDDVFQRRNNKLVRSLVNSAGHGKISSFVGTRVLKKLGAVNFHPIDRLQRRVVDIGVDKWLDYKEARAERHNTELRTGVDPPNIPDSDGIEQSSGEGDSKTVDTDATNKADNLARETTELKTKAQAPDVDVKALKADVLNKVKTGSGYAAAIAVMCAVRGFGETAIEQKVRNTLEVAQRIGFEHISIASQLITLEDLSVEEIRYFWEIMEDEEGYDMFASVAAQGAMGKTISNPEDLADYENPQINANLVIDAYEKPLIFRILDKVPLLGSACGLQEGIFGFISGIPVLGSAVDLAGELQEKAISTGLKVVSGYSMEDVINMSIEAVNGAGLDPLAEGIERGNIAMYGGLFAANTNEYAKGGVALSDAAAAQLEEYRAVAEKEERMEKNLFARMFDIQDTKSLIAQAIIDTPSSYKGASYALLESLNPLSLASATANSFTGKASAATNTFDYGVPKFGFSLDEKDNEKIEDPIENAVFVEQNFARLNSKYGECFPSKFDDDLNLSIPSLAEEPVNQFTVSDTCLGYMDGSTLTSVEEEEFLRFRVYLYDTISMVSLACFEGDGQACDKIGANNAPINTGTISGGGTTGQTIADFTGPVINCDGDPREQVFINESNNVLNWTTVTPTGIIGQDSGGLDIPVYVRDACAGQTEVRTIVIASGVHGLENGGQRVAWELLFNTQLPPDVRVVAIPEVSPWAVANSRRTNANGVNLNRNFDYEWGTKSRDDPNPGSGDYRGPSAASEPETQAIQNFLTTLGRTSFLASYHSNLNYVASSGPNQLAHENIEQRYYELALPYNIPNSDGDNWKTSNESGTGFLEGWYNFATGSPSFLLELTDSAKTTTEYTKGHAETIKKLLEEGVIR